MLMPWLGTMPGRACLWRSEGETGLLLVDCASSAMAAVSGAGRGKEEAAEGAGGGQGCGDGGQSMFGGRWLPLPVSFGGDGQCEEGDNSEQGVGGVRDWRWGEKDRELSFAHGRAGLARLVSHLK